MGLGLLLLVFIAALLFAVIAAFATTFAAVLWPVYFWPRRWVSYVPAILLVIYLIHTGGKLSFLG